MTDFRCTQMDTLTANRPPPNRSAAQGAIIFFFKKRKIFDGQKVSSRHHDLPPNSPQLHHDLPSPNHPKTPKPLQKRLSTTKNIFPTPQPPNSRSSRSLHGKCHHSLPLNSFCCPNDAQAMQDELISKAQLLGV